MNVVADHHRTMVDYFRMLVRYIEADVHSVDFDNMADCSELHQYYYVALKLYAIRYNVSGEYSLTILSLVTSRLDTPSKPIKAPLR